MNLRQLSGIGRSSSKEKANASVADADRCLTLLAEGAALNMPEIDIGSYKEFRANIGKLALRIPDRLPDDDKLAVIQTIIHELENYRRNADSALRGRLAGWRGLVTTLFRELLGSLGIDPASADAAPLVQRVGSLLTSEEIQAFRIDLTNFLRVGGADGPGVKGSPLKEKDRSTANDNASGLRGGGAAVEHVKKIMDNNGSGFVVLFQLGCLDVIGERFGWEAVQDSLMAVSAFLTHSLRSDDAVYHWSDSSLLVVLQSPATEQILMAAMRRVVDNNRDITIQVGGRSVMLRIPLEFDLIPISRLRSADDLHKLSLQSTKFR